MAAPIVVQTCWRGHRTPAGVESEIAHLECDGVPGYSGYGRALWFNWYGRGVEDAPGLWVIEHDVAVDPGDAEVMLAAIADHPGEVVAAPYVCWPISTNLDAPFALPDVHAGRPRFGLGCTYLPERLIEAAGDTLADWTYPTLDAELSALAHATGVPVVTVRGTHVKHLHY